MSNYRRSRDGQIYSFTVATDQHRPILTTDAGPRHLLPAIDEVKSEAPFDIIAIVLLPDDLQAITLQRA